MKRQIIIASVLIVFSALIVAGCGSDSSSNSSGSTSEKVSAEFAGSTKGEAEGSKFASFGQEANSEEREAASKVLEQNLRDRAAHKWAGQCASLSAKQYANIKERAEFITGKKGKGSCAEGLKFEAEPAPPSILKNPMTGPIDVLRVEGNKAYALFHGTENKDYGMPMVKEDGEWKVDGLVTVPLAKG